MFSTHVWTERFCFNIESLVFPFFFVWSGRSSEDEAYISSIVTSNPGSSFLYIVDTRPKINAMANRAGGKGYESEAFYSNTKFVFKVCMNRFTL